MAKILIQSTTDSQPLKTYKIKNHNSGKTYTVKAVSYTDAVRKYNEYIKDAFIEDNNFNSLFQFEKELKALSHKSDPQALRSVFSKAETITKQVERSIADLTKQLRTAFANWKKNSNNQTARANYYAVDKLVWDVSTALETCVEFFKPNGGKIIRVLFENQSRFKDKADEYLQIAKRYYDRFKQISTLLSSSNYLRDSITEDSLTEDSFIEDNSFDPLFRFEKELKNIPHNSDEQTIRSIFSKAETIAKQVENSFRGLSTQFKTKLTNWRKNVRNNTAATQYFEVEKVINSVSVALRTCVDFFRPTERGQITKVLHNWHNGKIVGQRFGNRTDKYLSLAKKYHDRFSQLLTQFSSLNVVDLITEDSLIEDAEILFTASIEFTSDKPKTKGINKGYTGGKYGGGSFNINQTIGDIITTFYNNMKKDFDDAESANIRVKKLSIGQYTQGDRNSFRQSVSIKEVEGKDVQSAIRIGNSIKLSKYIKDSIAEDSLTEDDAMDDAKQFLLTTYNNYCKGKTYKDIPKIWNDLKRVMTAYKNGIFKWSTYSFKYEHYMHAVVSGKDPSYVGSPKVWLTITLDFETGNAKVAHEIGNRLSFKQEFTIPKFKKDSITEDALSKFVQSYLSTKKVSSKAEQDEIIKFLLERNKITTEDIPKVRSLLKIIKDSLTEDADIAQNDIKSTYLPEDANADNIQYLGFNEKRKLSFYSYGDRYFVHYDLEGRTEEIDKETVQKILKKNILGEIDENDLINKEPQSEEIVSDDFDWTTTQERGDE